MAFIAGLVTVTFRQLAPAQIVEVAQRAGLATLEWGGDVHVPPGDLQRAADVRAMTDDAGLSIAAYGSYFRVGDDDVSQFQPVLETALALGAPSIRIWPGRRASAAADAGYRRRVIDDSLRCSELASAAGVTICYEYHEGTLTDTDASALDLLYATRHPAIKTLWQPPHEVPLQQALGSLRGILPWLQHVHVFHWPVRRTRVPLAEGADRWRQYLKLLHDAGKCCPLLLEFVKNDDPAQLIKDAATLLGWIKDIA